MKLFGICTKSHQPLRDQWFFPTLPDEFDVTIESSNVRGTGYFEEDDWKQAIKEKDELIIEAIRSCWGDAFVYADMDIQFFAPIREALETALRGHDIVCQAERTGNLCAGFFAIRANKRTLSVWERTYKALPEIGRDQQIFNRFVRQSEELRWEYLPRTFFGASCGLREPTGEEYRAYLEGRDPYPPYFWKEGRELNIPAHIVMHHANWCLGVDRKLAQLMYVRQKRGTAAEVGNPHSLR